MREILFKAKQLYDGEWVEGDLIHSFDGENRFAISNAAGLHEIVPYTICQYTGLTDKNGNKIWENDIVRYEDDLANMVKVDLIGWNETHAAFTILADEKGNMKYYYIDEFIASNFEVIRNIFDNPELMENK